MYIYIYIYKILLANKWKNSQGKLENISRQMKMEKQYNTFMGNSGNQAKRENYSYKHAIKKLERFQINKLTLQHKEFIKIRLILLDVCECFACTCVCTPHVWLASSKIRRGCWIPWDWSYRWPRGMTGAVTQTQILSKNNQCS